MGEVEEGAALVATVEGRFWETESELNVIVND